MIPMAEEEYSVLNVFCHLGILQYISALGSDLYCNKDYLFLCYLCANVDY